MTHPQTPPPKEKIHSPHILLRGSSSLLKAVLPVVRLFPEILITDDQEALPESVPILLAGHNLQLPPQGYRITPDATGLKLDSRDTPGLLYGLITLIREISESSNVLKKSLPTAGSPAFDHRGFMLDVSRHFYKTEEILRILDLCLILRLNRFHWHLTDDQGWRIESRVYPKLHIHGGRRTPFRGDRDTCDGFYSREEIRQVVSYAEERGITVIPEIDVPGHSTALLSAYPHLSCSGKPIPVARRPGIYPDVLCPGNQEVYTFLIQVLEDILPLFPGPWVHLGGDEVTPSRWRRCPRCQALMKQENLKTESELHGYFMNRVIQQVEALGKVAVVWNDAVGPLTASAAADLNPRAVMQFWREKNGASRSKETFLSGRKTIISDFWHLYLDYPHGMTSLRKIQEWDAAKTFDTGDFSMTPILGIEAPLWTEYVFTPKKLYRMILPRLYAVADNAWRGKPDPDYQRFLRQTETLDTLCRRLGYEGTSLHNADPGPITSVFQVIRFVISAFKRLFL